VLQVSERNKNSKGRRRTLNLDGDFEEFVDESILTPDSMPAQPPHLALPNYVHCLIALDRSSRSLELTKPCLAFMRRLIALWSCSMMLFRYWTGGGGTDPAASLPYSCLRWPSCSSGPDPY
jgi:hypothetical protein